MRPTAGINTLGVAWVLTLCFIPYTTIVNTGTDVQVYALILAGHSLILALSKNGLPITRNMSAGYIFLFSIVLAYFFIGAYISVLEAARSLYGYISMLVFFIYGRLMFDRRNTVNLGKLLEIFVWIWLAAAASEFLGRKGILPFDVSQLLTSRDITIQNSRGLRSLAPEPSYYAFVMLYALIFSQLLFAQGLIDIRRRYIIEIFCVVQMLLTASGTGLVLIFVWFVFRVFRAPKHFMPVTIAGSALAIVIFFSQPTWLLNMRAMHILSELNTYGPMLIWRDASIAGRVFTIWLVLKSVVEFFPFGGGFGTFFQYKLANEAFFSDMYIYSQYTLPEGRPAGLLSILYELNVFSLPFFLFGLASIWRALGSGILPLIAIGSLPLIIGSSLALPTPFLLLGFMSRIGSDRSPQT